MKTKRILNNKMEIKTASGDCLVLIDPSNRSKLRILQRNGDEWPLTVEGYVKECFVTKEIMILLTRFEDLGLKMEVYDLFSHDKMMERTLGKHYKVFCDEGCCIFLEDDNLEIINAKDPSLSFKFSWHELEYKSVGIINFEFPLLLVRDYIKGGLSVLKIDDKDRRTSIVFKIELDPYSNLQDAAFIGTKVALLEDEPDAALGSLTVINANGDEVRKIMWHDDENGPYW